MTDRLTVQPRHPEIQEHQLGTEPLGLRHRLIAVVNGPDVAPEVFEEHRKGIGGVGVVVGDQHPTADETGRLARQLRTRRLGRVRNRGHRQVDDELAAVAAALALYIDGAVVHFDEALGQCQPDTEAAAGGVRAWPAWENISKMRG